MANQAIKVAQDIVILKSMAAWKEIEGYLKTKETKLIRALVREDNPETRGRIKELNDFEKFLGLKLLNGAEALADLE